MEEPKRTRNDQQKKNLAIKTGGGGGIGAVVVLGGVLATAALASIFVVRKKGRSSGKGHRHRHQNPPPEIQKQNEQDETANEGPQRFICIDKPTDVYEQPSSGATKQIESDDNNPDLLVSSESLTMGEKPGIDINGGTPGDVQDFEPKSEQIHSSISQKKLEHNPNSDCPVVITEASFPLLVEQLPSEPQNTMQNEDEAKIQSTLENISSEITKVSKNLDQVQVHVDDGTNEGMNMNYNEAVQKTTTECSDQEEIEITSVDNAVEGVRIDQTEVAPENVDMEVKMEKEKEIEGLCCDNEQNIAKRYSSLSETIISESQREDGLKAVLPVFNGPVMECENVKGNEVVSESQSKNEQKAQVPVFNDPFMEHENVKGNEVVLESQSENEQKAPLPVFDSPVMEHENVKGIKVVFESHIEDGQKAILPVFDSTVIEQENENGEEKEATDGSREGEVKLTEENLVEEEEKCNLNDEGIVFVPRKCEEAELISEANQSNLQNDQLLKEELIFPVDDEDMKVDGANEDFAQSVEVRGNKTTAQFVDDKVKDSSKKIEEVVDSSKIIDEIADSSEMVEEVENSSEITEVGDSSEIIEEVEDSSETTQEAEDSSDEVEESESSVETGDSSTESNLGAVWPAETLSDSLVDRKQVKLVGSELQGKIEEDAAVPKTRQDYLADGKTMSEDSSFEPYQLKKGNSEKTFMAMLKVSAANSTRRTMIIGILSVLSSYSCSWFFGLSFVKLCLIVFLTMALSKIHGY